jgi:hypothetical protein
MFCAPGLVFCVTEGVDSRFYFLRAQTPFRRYRRRRVPISFFALRDTFSAVRRASDPVFMFCAPGLFFRGSEGVGYRFHVCTPFSFWAVRRASDPVFMFCAPRLVFSATKGIGSRFHVLHSWTRFPWYRGRRVPFLCFARPYSFSTVPRASSPIFMFCTPGLVFGGTEGAGSPFHVLRSRPLFRR